MPDRIAYAQFLASGAAATGLTVTVDVDKVERSTATRTPVATGGSATEGRDGWYMYSVASPDIRTYDYLVTFKTAGTADQKAIATLWTEFSPAAEYALPDAADGSSGGLVLLDEDGFVPNCLLAGGAVDAIWDEQRSDHVSPGSFGEGVASVQGPVAGSVGSVAGSVSGSVASVAAGVSLATGAITSSKIASGALNGKGDWLLATGYTAPDNAGIAAIATTLAAIKGSGWVTGDNLHEINQAIADGAGVGGDPWATDLAGGSYTGTEAGAVVQAIRALVAAGRLTLVSPVLADGTTTIVQGGDYLASIGTAIPYTVTGYAGPNPSGGTIRWRATRKDLYDVGGSAKYALASTATTATLSDGVLAVNVDLTAAQTAALTQTSPPDRDAGYVVEVELVTGAGLVVPLVLADLTVRKRIS